MSCVLTLSLLAGYVHATAMAVAWHQSGYQGKSDSFVDCTAFPVNDDSAVIEAENHYSFRGALTYRPVCSAGKCCALCHHEPTALLQGKHSHPAVHCMLHAAMAYTGPSPHHPCCTPAVLALLCLSIVSLCLTVACSAVHSCTHCLYSKLGAMHLRRAST